MLANESSLKKKMKQNIYCRHGNLEYLQLSMKDIYTFSLNILSQSIFFQTTGGGVFELGTSTSKGEILLAQTLDYNRDRNFTLNITVTVCP